MALENLSRIAADASQDDGVLRPRTLAGFIGQSDLKEKLSVNIRAALKRHDTMDHVLLSGPPGLGKTTLAAIIAAEMGGGFHTTAAPALSRPGDLAKILTVLEKGDILFIDEIHRLNRQCEEILYPAMEDGYIDFVLGEGVSAQSVKLHLKPFTLVAATTRSGMLTAPLKSRFGIDLKLEFYGEDDLMAIVLRTARLFELDFEPEAARTVASRSRMTPRVANRLVRRIRDYATLEHLSTVTERFASDCLDKLGVDGRGLVELDRALIRLMIERYGGGPVGIKTLSALVDEEERTIEEDHEPFMLRAGFWEKTPQGRIVTKKGYEHLGLPWRDKSRNDDTIPTLF